MPRQDQVRKLISMHENRLQKLKEQQALVGWAGDPKISLEIEEIEAKIEKLRIGSAESPTTNPVKPKDTDRESGATLQSGEPVFEARGQDFGLEAIYKKSDSPNVRTRVEDLILHSQHIAWVGTAINLLDVASVLDNLISRVECEECEVEIYLANPYSHQVNCRLIEEEIGTTPLIGRGGIIRRIQTLLNVQAKKGIPNSRLKIRLFNHYPTVALLLFDSHVIVYHYDYQELGNLSPAFCYRRDVGGLADYYLKVYERIKRDAVPAELVMREHGQFMHSQDWAQELSWFAVYLIPERSSKFYQKWSELVGYDIWQKKMFPPSPDLERFRGDAYTFGCHITVLDAMGAWGKSQFDMIREELRWLASQYQPISLRNLGYPKDFKKKALVVEFTDDSGQLESLHAELIVHFAAQAATSNYQIERHPAATLNMNDDRIRHMIERYHTPFCLNEFRPHLTVLGDLQDISIDEARELVIEAGGKILEKEPLRFDKICLMELSQDGSWRIAEAMKLGK
jgi:2'-5' RNA ligase